MGLWKYEGIDKDGNRTLGEMNARSEREVRKVLRSQGIRAKRVFPPSPLDFDISEWLIEQGIGARFTNEELALFTRQMAIMLDAGVSLVQALEILGSGQKNPKLRKITSSVKDQIEGGKTLSEALSNESGFSKIYCNLVKAGEAGGVLVHVFNKLADHLDSQIKTKKKVKGALTYPVIVVVVAAGLIVVMLTFVVPQFVSMIEDSGQEIPGITLFVMGISGWFQTNGFVVIISMFAAWGFFVVTRKTKEGKENWDKLFLRIPLFGNIIIKSNLTIFARTLGTMLSSGVPLVTGLELSVDIIDNEVIGEDIKKVKEAVIEGSTLSVPLGKIKYFPDMVAAMIKVGEQTGRTDEMLEKVSKVLEDEVSNLVENMTKMIEPMIIIVLGGVIGTILLAVFLPIVSGLGGAGGV